MRLRGHGATEGGGQATWLWGAQEARASGVMRDRGRRADEGTAKGGWLTGARQRDDMETNQHQQRKKYRGTHMSCVAEGSRRSHARLREVGGRPERGRQAGVVWPREAGGPTESWAAEGGGRRCCEGAQGAGVSGVGATG